MEFVIESLVILYVCLKILNKLLSLVSFHFGFYVSKWTNFIVGVSCVIEYMR